MADLVLGKEFLDAWGKVDNREADERIDTVLQLVAAVPGMGSSLMRDSVRHSYGPKALKALAGPYQIIYEYDEATQTVYVHGLLHSSLVT